MMNMTRMTGAGGRRHLWALMLVALLQGWAAPAQAAAISGAAAVTALAGMADVATVLGFVDGMLKGRGDRSNPQRENQIAVLIVEQMAETIGVTADGYMDFNRVQIDGLSSALVYVAQNAKIYNSTVDHGGLFLVNQLVVEQAKVGVLVAKQHVEVHGLRVGREGVFRGNTLYLGRPR